MGHMLSPNQFSQRASLPALVPQPLPSPSEATHGPTQPSRQGVVAASSVSPKTETDLTLSGIVEGLGEPYAVINGMIVGIGDQVKNVTLVAIEHGKAKLRQADGSEIILHVTR